MGAITQRHAATQHKNIAGASQAPKISYKIWGREVDPKIEFAVEFCVEFLVIGWAAGLSENFRSKLFSYIAKLRTFKQSASVHNTVPILGWKIP